MICKECQDISISAFTITTDDSFQLYFDGVEQTNLPNQNDWQKTDTVDLPWGTRVIAVAGTNNYGQAGILASSSDGSILTDASWKCSKILEDDWMEETFNDCGWPAATEISRNEIGAWGNYSDINSAAMWIWHSVTEDLNTIYCRVNLRKFVKPFFLACHDGVGVCALG